MSPEKRRMRTDRIKIATTVSATLTAILFIILVKLFPKWAITLLAAELVLLPSIYIIGSTVAEGAIKKNYEDKLEALLSKSENLQQKYYNLVMEYQLIIGEKWQKDTRNPRLKK